MLVSLNWLKEFVDIRLKPGELANKLTMAGFEVEGLTSVDGDTILDINVTPNRGDCLSVIGIAREIAAINGKKIPDPKSQIPNKFQIPNSKLKIKDFISVKIEDKEKCPRYCAKAITDVKIAPSPAWLAKRLESCGIRSINNVVDATNYVMLETGQPFHAFDLRFIRGGKIIIKTPNEDIDFVTLDGAARKVIKDDLLICDAEGPVAIAGVMGGLNSEVRGDTKTIVLESACFNPVSVRRTAKRLGLQSESSRRFEKGVDPNTTALFLNRLASLILSNAGGLPTKDVIDIYPKRVRPVKIKFSVRKANTLLGVEVKQEHIKKYFKALGIPFSKGVCVVPTYRPDLTRPADLVEEVGRLYGYHKIPATLPAYEMSVAIKPVGRDITESARCFLTAHGFYEAVNYGFCSPSELLPFSKDHPVIISNPLGTEFSAMKTTLIPGLLKNLKLNIDHGCESLRLFELRPVFLNRGGLVSEEARLSGVICGRRSSLTWAYRPEEFDFYDVKGTCEGLAAYIGLTKISFAGARTCEFLHPQASSVILYNEEETGLCGLLHPAISERLDIKGNVFLFELKWEKWITAAEGEKRSFRGMERFPSVRRDVALLLDDVIDSACVLSSVKAFDCKIIKEAVPFDIYRGKGIPEGKKSVAYAVIYADPGRTLTDEEVNDTHARLAGYLKDKLGAEIR